MEIDKNQVLISRLSQYAARIDPPASYWLMVLTESGVYDEEDHSRLLSAYRDHNLASPVVSVLQATVGTSPDRVEETIKALLQISKRDEDICFNILRTVYQDLKRSDDENLYENFPELERLIEDSDDSESFREVVLDRSERVYHDEYIFYRRLRNVISESSEEVYFVDSYINSELIDLYLSEISNDVKKRILTKKVEGKEEFQIQFEKYTKRSDRNVEIRKSGSVHDRLLFVDNRTFAIGISIKDAGNKPTYLVELDRQSVIRNCYEDMWEDSETIYTG